MAPQQSEMTSPIYRFRVVRYGDDVTDSRFIRAKAVPEDRIKAIETQCKVKIVLDPATCIYTVIPDLSNRKDPKDCYPNAALQSMNYALERGLQDGYLTPARLRGEIETRKEKEGDLKDQRGRARSVRKMYDSYMEETLRNQDIDPAEGAEQNKQPPIVAETKMVPVPLPEDSTEVPGFLALLHKTKRTSILSLFSEDPRIALDAVFDPAKPNVLMTTLKTYADGTTNSDNIIFLGKLIAKVAEQKTKAQERPDYRWLADIVDNILHPIFFQPRKKAVLKSELNANTPQISTLTVEISTLNGRDLKDLAQHLTQPSRAASLAAFSDSGLKPLNGVKVRLDNKEKPEGFFVTVPAVNGVANKNVLDFISTALSDAAKVFQEANRLRSLDEHTKVANSHLDKAWFKEWLKNNISLLEESPEKLSPVYRSTVDIFKGLAAEQKDEADMAVAMRQAFVVNSAPKIYMPGEVSFKSRVDFDLPEFDDDGIMRLMTLDGVEKLIRPTRNQLPMIKDFIDPDKKLIYVSGPPATGKSLFAAWAQLKLIKEGILARGYYERPLQNVGGIRIGFIPGTTEEKTDPNNGAFENIYVRLLGFGSETRGRDIFNSLVAERILTRFMGLHQRGATIFDSFLFVDEAQNKFDEELWNLETRSEGGKVVISGDHETQTDIRNSAMSRHIEMYKGVEGVSFHTMTRDDMHRDPLIQKLYDARVKYREKMEISKTYSRAANNNNTEDTRDESSVYVPESPAQSRKLTHS